MKSVKEDFVPRKPDVKMCGYGVVPYLAQERDPHGKYKEERELVYRLKNGDREAIDTIVAKAHAAVKGWVTERTVWVPLTCSRKTGPVEA